MALRCTTPCARTARSGAANWPIPRAGRSSTSKVTRAAQSTGGRLCPKGANTLQLVANLHRITRLRYRAPNSDQWEDKPIEWALEWIAQLVKETRDDGLIEEDGDGIIVNHVKNMAMIGGSAADNEEGYLAAKLLKGDLGLLGV